MTFVRPADQINRFPLLLLPYRRSAMPMYDYKCLDCGKESLIAMTLKEHESGTVTCPACGSKKMEQLITVYRQDDKKS